MLACVLAGGCGSVRPDADPADYLAVGVDPAVEAHTLEATLAASGMRLTREVVSDGWVAFAMTRDDGASLARVITHRGVAVALDEGASAVSPARGVLDVLPSPPSGTDVDGDGTPDVVLVRTERDRTCEMIVGIDADSMTHPLVVDASSLPDGACIEDVRDVDGSATPEVVVRVRARSIARSVTPTADLPLERDASGVYRRVDPAERFVEGERSSRATRLATARTAPDAELAYTVALELALVSYVAGEAPDAQLAAFDAAIEGVVLDIDLLTAVELARHRIAAGRVAE